MKGNFQKRIFQKLLNRFPSHLECQVAYIKKIKYINFIEIGLVAIEI